MPRKVDAQQQLRLDDIVSIEPRPIRRERAPGIERIELSSRGHQKAVAATQAVRRPSAADLLGTPGALLTRSHLRGLGLERRAIDAVFRTLPVVALPGYSRPMIRADQYLELVEQHTYRDDRVRPRHA
jgi:hypothetical protein